MRDRGEQRMIGFAMLRRTQLNRPEARDERAQNRVGGREMLYGAPEFFMPPPRSRNKRNKAIALKKT